MRKKYIIIAYACEDKGSEPGVGFHWAKAILKLNIDGETIIITRKNNNILRLTEDKKGKVIGIDVAKRFLFFKKLFGIRTYYLLWTILVFFHLLKNFRLYKNHTVHHITFTPIYYPPIYFILPFKYNWGPVGGGETFPNVYLKSMKFKDILSEFVRICIKYSIYINPFFYFGCFHSENIICSTYETKALIPKIFKKKVTVELMVMDYDKFNIRSQTEKTIVIANRLINWKMTHLFVEAFSDFIRKNKTDYKLIIIGNGPYLNKIKPFIDNQQIIHYCSFEKRIDMLNILKKASLFVSMSLRDSGAATLLEAVSYHIPFLVTNSGAHKLFLDNDIGFTFNLENYNIDKKKIEKILSKILFENVLIKEKEKVKEKYSLFYSEEIKFNRIQKILE